MKAGRVRGRLLTAAAVACLPAALSGCGGGSKTPTASELPLLPGAKVVARATRCDRGANAYCALELVVVDRRFKNSQQLFDAEHDLVHQKGWRGVTGDTQDERAAESPGRALRVTYGTPDGDLRGIDLGWIRRSRSIAYALARTLFDHMPALSVLLERGSS